MCLWGEQMIWYQGEDASAFTDAFSRLGPVFVRGQASQWTIERSCALKARSYALSSPPIPLKPVLI